MSRRRQRRRRDSRARVLYRPRPAAAAPQSPVRRLADLLGRIGGVRVAVQVVAIAVGATLTGLAGWLYSDAASSWQQAVRDDVNRYGVDQNDVRTVYANEGQLAFRIAAMQIRAQALESVRDAGPTARIQYDVAVQTSFALRRRATLDGVGGNRVYDLPGGGADLPRRLAAMAATRGPAPDPDASSRAGDRQAGTARDIALATAVVTGLAVLAACLRSPGPRSPGPRSPGPRSASRCGAGGRDADRRGAGRRDADRRRGTPAVELFPQPGAAPRRQRRTAQLLLAVWAAGILVPLVQLTLSSEEQRAQARSARTAVRERAERSISETRAQFRAAARQQATETDMNATAREIGAVYATPAAAAEARAIAHAEEVAAARCTEVADAMARAPEPRDGLDRRLAAALISGQDAWNALADRTRQETARGDAFGLASNLTIVLISLIVVAEARIEIRHAHR